MALDDLSLTFAALAHPIRRAILTRLSKGEASVQELAKPFKLSMPAVSRHLKVLEKSGLITRGRDAQWRPCRLELKPMKKAVDWMEEHRVEWEGRLDRLTEYLDELQKNEGTQEKEKSSPETQGPSGEGPAKPKQGKPKQ